jgi:hypothetical protein
LSLSVATLPVAARLVAVALAVESTAVLTDREVGRFPLRRLTLWTRKRGANQRSMDGPLVFCPLGRGLVLNHLGGFGRFRFFRSF